MRHNKEGKKRYIYFKLLLIKLFRSDTVKTVVCFFFIMSHVYGLFRFILKWLPTSRFKYKNFTDATQFKFYSSHNEASCKK